MEGICVNVNDPDLFFQFLKGRCHGNQFYGKIWVYAFIWHSENGLQYRHSDSKIFNGNILATLCANMMENQSSNPRDYDGNK